MSSEGICENCKDNVSPNRKALLIKEATHLPIESAK